MQDAKEITQAANEALKELGIENTEVIQAVMHAASYDFDTNKWSVHFREKSGKYFRVTINMIEIHQRTGTTTQEGIKDEIIRKLQERDPNDYMD
jgi:hypothetical protein